MAKTHTPDVHKPLHLLGEITGLLDGRDTDNAAYQVIPLERRQGRDNWSVETFVNILDQATGTTHRLRVEVHDTHQGGSA